MRPLVFQCRFANRESRRSAVVGFCPCRHRSVRLLDSRYHAIWRNYSASLFSRNALRMVARLTPLLKVYQVGLFPIAKPTAIILNWWLGPEGITFLRERDFQALITKHVGAVRADVGHLEAIGALNFLDLDDILVVDEGSRSTRAASSPFPSITNGRCCRNSNVRPMTRPCGN
jgi:hypothetical protein